MALGMEVGLGPVHIVLDGDTAPLPKKGLSPQIFGPCLLWPNGCMDQDATWHEDVFIVFDVDPTTPRKKGTPTTTQFLAHVCCGQMSGWMKMPLRMEVDPGPRHIVIDRVPAPEKGAQHPPPSFRPMSLWPRSPISATAELL